MRITDLSSTQRASVQDKLPADSRNDFGESPSFRASKPRPSLFPLLQLMWRHRRTLFLSAVYAVIGSTVLAFLIPVRYQSVARLMPPDNDTGALGTIAALASNTGTGALNG